MSDLVPVTVYARENCHLCEDALSTTKEVADGVDNSVAVKTVDVDNDSDLRERYGDRVPYVLVDGRPAFKFRVDEADLRRRFTGE